MDDKGYSTYNWVIEELGNDISYNSTKDGDSITVKATITKTKVFALIVGNYQVTVNGTYNITLDEDESISKNFTAICTCKINKNPQLCTKEGDSYKIDLILNGKIVYNDEYNKPDENTIINYNYTDFKIQENGGIVKNDYLYILQKPKLIRSLMIDGNTIDETYVKNSAIPVNKIKNISTKDFHNIKINSDEGLNIFHKLSDDNDIGVNITTNALDIPKLTEVNLPEKEDEQIVICKSKSKNRGITFKTSDPDIGNRNFGYVIDIEGYRSAGYNSVWVNRKTLDKMFIGLPDDIMSTTKKFEYNNNNDKSFKFNKLTYNIVDINAPIHINDDEEMFSDTDEKKLKTKDYAPTYKAVTINESIDAVRHNYMLLKNIEFVKFGDKVIKLNYEPLSETQNQSI